MTASKRVHLGLFVSFALPTNPLTQGRGGGGGTVTRPVYCRAFSFTRCCSKIIGLNNYYVARLCSPRNYLARVSFIVTSVSLSIIVLPSGQHYLYLLLFFILK